MPRLATRAAVSALLILAPAAASAVVTNRGGTLTDTPTVVSNTGAANGAAPAAAPSAGTADSTAPAAAPAPAAKPRGFPWGLLGLVGLIGLWPLFRRRSDG